MSAPYLPRPGEEARANAAPPFHAFERERLASLREHAPHVPMGDAAMVSLACEATDVCTSPVGMVSLLEEHEERVVACIGKEFKGAERSVSICAYTILEPDALVVEDLSADPRFRDNPFVVGEPFIRFYAGAPIFDGGGLPLGAVCVVDVQPHEISSKCLLALRRLAAVAGAAMEIRLLFAKTRRRGATEEEARAWRSQLDELLLTAVESRPSCND